MLAIFAGCWLRVLRRTTPHLARKFLARWSDPKSRARPPRCLWLPPWFDVYWCVIGAGDLMVRRKGWGAQPSRNVQVCSHIMSLWSTSLIFLITSPGSLDGAKVDLVESIAIVPDLRRVLLRWPTYTWNKETRKKHSNALTRRLAITPTIPVPFITEGKVRIYIRMYHFSYWLQTSCQYHLSWLNEAADNYTLLTELDDTFVFGLVQLAIAQYKSGNLDNGMAAFRKMLKAFPQRSELHNY